APGAHVHRRLVRSPRPDPHDGRRESRGRAGARPRRHGPGEGPDVPVLRSAGALSRRRRARPVVRRPGHLRRSARDHRADGTPDRPPPARRARRPSVMRRLAAACAALLLTVGLAACSSDTDSADSAAALEEYVETMQAEVPTFLESFTMYSDFRIEADPPSTLVYEYDFTDE